MWFGGIRLVGAGDRGCVCIIDWGVRNLLFFSCGFHGETDNPETLTEIVIMRRVNRLMLSIGAVAMLASCEAMKPRQQAAADPYGTYGTGNEGGAAYGYGGQGQAAATNDPYATAPYGQTDYGAGTASVPSSGGYSGGGGGGNSYSGGGSGGGGGRTHVVAAGENLTKIGRRYGVSVDALVRANNLASPDHIEAGKALTIP